MLLNEILKKICELQVVVQYGQTCEQEFGFNCK